MFFKTLTTNEHNSLARIVLRKTIACLLYNFDISPWNNKLDMEMGYIYLNTYPRKGHEGYLCTRLMHRFLS